MFLKNIRIRCKKNLPNIELKTFQFYSLVGITFDIHPKCLINSVENPQAKRDNPLYILNREYEDKAYQFYLVKYLRDWYRPRGKTDEMTYINNRDIWIEEGQFDFEWITLSDLVTAINQNKDVGVLDKYLNLMKYAENEMRNEYVV